MTAELVQRGIVPEHWELDGVSHRRLVHYLMGLPGYMEMAMRALRPLCSRFARLQTRRAARCFAYALARRQLKQRITYTVLGLVQKSSVGGRHRDYDVIFHTGNAVRELEEGE